MLIELILLVNKKNYINAPHIAAYKICYYVHVKRMILKSFPWAFFNPFDLVQPILSELLK